MTVDIRIASLADRPLWDDIQTASGIASHGWSYAQALSRSGLEPRLAIVAGAGGRLIIPFFERSWQGTTDICTWLSVSGARMEPPLRPLLDAWCDYCRSRSWVAGYLQVEPESSLAGIDEARADNEVFLLDLTLPDLLAPASQLIRRKVRRATAEGATLVQDREALTEALVRLYPQTIERVGASPAYSLPEAALHGMAQASDVMMLGAGGPDGIEAVMVFPFTSRRAEFFINAGTERGRDLNAWLLWQAMRRLAGAGVEMLNLGGGVRRGDGLYRFKAMFGAAARPLRAVRQIYDAETYSRLCAQAGAGPGTAWFPAYRAPRPAARDG